MLGALPEEVGTPLGSEAEGALHNFMAILPPIPYFLFSFYQRYVST